MLAARAAEPCPTQTFSSYFLSPLDREQAPSSSADRSPPIALLFFTTSNNAKSPRAPTLIFARRAGRLASPA